MQRLAEFVWNSRPIALVAGGILWLTWAVSCVLGTGTLDLNGQVIGTDHTAFHTAAALLADGRGEAIYAYPDLAEFEERQAELTGKPGFLDPFRNPPYYALLYLPTARLSYLLSFGIWAILSLVSLAAALVLVNGWRMGKPLLWSLSFYPVFAAISFGQNTLLSLGAFALIHRCLKAEHRFLAGMAASLLLFKPQLLLGLGVWWLLDIRKLWPCALGGMAGAALIAALSVVLVPDETVEWLRRLPDIAKYDAFEFYNLHNMRGFGSLLTGDKIVGNAFGLVGLTLSIVWLVRFWKRFRENRSLMFAAAVLATLWGSPHTMTYEWALAILPAVVLWRNYPEHRRYWCLMFGLTWMVLFVSTPLANAQLRALGIAVQISVPAIALLLLAIEARLRRA